MSSKIELGTIDSLIPDDKNANRGTEYGDSLLDKSITTLGLGRSVLVDKDNRLIAGNKTTEKAVAAGFNKVIFVDTDGTELVVVRRKDISLDSKEGRELALADNKVAEVNLDWDMDVVQGLADDLNIDLNAWGMAPFESPTPKEKEVDELSGDHKCPKCGHEW